MGLDRRLWEPFGRCGQTAESLVPLRSCLIRMWQDWDELGIAAGDCLCPCPFTFTEDELREHEESLGRYQDQLYPHNLIKDQLGTDDEGWIALADWEAARTTNQQLLATYIETMADEPSPDEARRSWPFRDNALEGHS